MPNYLISQSPDKVILRNFEGVISAYSQPREYKNCSCEKCSSKQQSTIGVAELMHGSKVSIEPNNLERLKRGKDRG